MFTYWILGSTGAILCIMTYKVMVWTYRKGRLLGNGLVDRWYYYSLNKWYKEHKMGG